MNILFTYMLKVAVYLTAFYLVYALLLSSDKSYTRNRLYIIFSFMSALIMPLITLHTNNPSGIQFFGKFLSEALVTASKTSHTGISLNFLIRMFYSIYSIVVIIFLLKLSIDLINLLFLILRHHDKGSRIIRFHGFNTSGFSAMGFIFINSRLSPADADEIIKHERNHLKSNHFLDILFIELVKAFQWFNPSVYLFNRSLRAIHEYQADQECLNSGITIVNYQNLLLKQVFKSRVFNLTNSFSNPSLIRKRMVMMTKKRTSALAGIKMILVIPVAGAVLLTISAFNDRPGSSAKQPVQVAATEKSDEEPFTVVEEMPFFPGGDRALLKYLSENTIYPESAREQNLQGKVIIRFCINPDGSVSLVSVLKGVSPDLDSEAIRVVKTLPAFGPGRQNGKAVPVWYMVPIAFTLK